MKSEAILFMERWFEEVWNRQNEALIEEMLHPECAIHGMGDEVSYGVEGFMPLYRAFLQAFPDVHITLTEVFESAGRVIAKFGGKGTHLGRFGDLDATGRPITIDGMAFGRVVDGKLVEAWNEIDLGKMIMQITEPVSKSAE